MIKNSGLEEYFISKVTKFREKEMNLFKKQNQIESISSNLWLITSNLVILSIFGTYVLFNFELKTSIAITVIMLLQMLSDSLMTIPSSISSILSTFSSLSQLISFLNLKEIKNIENIEKNELNLDLDLNDVIRFKNVNISMNDDNDDEDKSNEQDKVNDKEDDELKEEISSPSSSSNKRMKYESKDEFILKNLNFTIKKGEFISIIGKVGSGKSLLLKSILGETILKSGSIK